MTGLNHYILYLIIPFLLVFSGSPDYAPVVDEDIIHIELTERAFDDKFEKSQAIVPLFEYEKDEIEEYTLISEFEKKELKHFKVTLPDMEGTIDTAYSFLFFGASVNEPNKGYALMIVGNYRRGTRPALLYVDKNLNYDLSDDGPPDTMRYTDEYVDITLTNPTLPEATYITRLSRFPIGKNEAYKKLLGDHYQKNSGKKKFTSVNFSFREQRINVISGTYNQGNDSFSIALKDNNCNGIYNEEGTDLLYIAPYDDTLFTRNALELNYGKKEPTTFEWNGKKYLIHAIDKAGKYIELKVDKDAELINQLKTCKKIPKFKFVTPDNRVYSIKDFKKDKKPIYLFIYSKHDPSFKEDMATIRQLDAKYKEQLTVICLNYGETPKEVWGSIYFDNLTWLVGLSNANINNLLFIEETPTGLLLTHKRRLCKSGVKPQELLAYYQKTNP